MGGGSRGERCPSLPFFPRWRGGGGAASSPPPKKHANIGAGNDNIRVLIGTVSCAQGPSFDVASS